MIIFKKFQQIKEIYNAEFSGDVQFFCFSPEIILFWTTFVQKIQIVSLS